MSKILKDNGIYIALAYGSMLLCLCTCVPAAPAPEPGMGELRRDRADRSGNLRSDSKVRKAGVEEQHPTSNTLVSSPGTRESEHLCPARPTGSKVEPCS